jgi:hypothetical protein
VGQFAIQVFLYLTFPWVRVGGDILYYPFLYFCEAINLFIVNRGPACDSRSCCLVII